MFLFRLRFGLFIFFLISVAVGGWWWIANYKQRFETIITLEDRNLCNMATPCERLRWQCPTRFNVRITRSYEEGATLGEDGMWRNFIPIPEEACVEETGKKEKRLASTRLDDPFDFEDGPKGRSEKHSFSIKSDEGKNKRHVRVSEPNLASFPSWTEWKKFFGELKDLITPKKQ